jgi:hypothetical protein
LDSTCRAELGLLAEHITAALHEQLGQTHQKAQTWRFIAEYHKVAFFSA